EPDVHGLFGAHPSRCEEIFGRALVAHDAWEEHARARFRYDAEADEGATKARRACEVRHVGMAENRRTDAERHAVHGGDDGLVASHEPIEETLEADGSIRGSDVAHLREVLSR